MILKNKKFLITITVISAILLLFSSKWKKQKAGIVSTVSQQTSSSSQNKTKTKNEQKSVIYSFYLDDDRDGLSNAKEIIYGTDPLNPDTDNDSYTDGNEVKHGYDPLLPGSARLKNRKTNNLTQQFFLWAQETKNISEPTLSPNLINEFIDSQINTEVKLPKIELDELNILYLDKNENNLEEIQKYLIGLKKISLPDNFKNYQEIAEKALNGETELLNNALNSLNQTQEKLLNLAVPSQLAEIHQGYIGMTKFLTQLFDDLRNVQKDPIKMYINAKKGQKLVKIVKDFDNQLKEKVKQIVK